MTTGYLQEIEMTWFLLKMLLYVVYIYICISIDHYTLYYTCHFTYLHYHNMLYYAGISTWLSIFPGLSAHQSKNGSWRGVFRHV